jgi:predicted O-linked N-acetylglucosamine transferase (SPINDLY family)
VAAFDHFFDVGAKSDVEIAALIHEHEIDIVVDVKGYTGHSRPGILAYRPAPVQVSYLAYPGTLGAPYIDYIIGDHQTIPPGSESEFSEAVVRVTGSYQINDRQRHRPDTALGREELGLPEDGFVFASFNNTHKITPPVFDVWMRLLGRVKGSVLWLYQATPGAADNLRQHARHRGIDPARLVFAPHWPVARHMARIGRADLFLDTLPYNAHTTASDALWAGVPVLTCMGHAFAARVAASLLTAVGLPELITHSLEAYENKALELAENPELLAAARTHLSTNPLMLPLFNTPRACDDLERAFITMHERCQQGLAPAAITL